MFVGFSSARAKSVDGISELYLFAPSCAPQLAKTCLPLQPPFFNVSSSQRRRNEQGDGNAIQYARETDHHHKHATQSGPPPPPPPPSHRSVRKKKEKRTEMCCPNIWNRWKVHLGTSSEPAPTFGDSEPPSLRLTGTHLQSASEEHREGREALSIIGGQALRHSWDVNLECMC